MSFIYALLTVYFINLQSRFEETDEVYGKLYRPANGSIPDPKEGWISKLRLELYELGK